MMSNPNNSREQWFHDCVSGHQLICDFHTNLHVEWASLLALGSVYFKNIPLFDCDSNCRPTDFVWSTQGLKIMDMNAHDIKHDTGRVDFEHSCKPLYCHAIIAAIVLSQQCAWIIVRAKVMFVAHDEHTWRRNLIVLCPKFPSGLSISTFVRTR